MRCVLKPAGENDQEWAIVPRPTLTPRERATRRAHPGSCVVMLGLCACARACAFERGSHVGRGREIETRDER
jgi:hypothetical protein